MLLNNIQHIYSSLPHEIIKENQPLADLSTLGTGGKAEYFAQPQSPDELQQLIRAIRSEDSPFELPLPVCVIGGGTNTLIDDGITHGLTVSTRKMNSLKWLNDSTAEIQSGFSLPVLVRTLRERNIGGLEFAEGIPGTLGGALTGNAGAGGKGVCEYAESVKAVDSSGNIRTLARGEFEYGYRICSLSEEELIIVSAVMTFNSTLAYDERAGEYFRSKRGTQPLNARSAGCTFKNPEGVSAGKLLDECGCKGLSVGDAAVSDKHANFILNKGHASSADICELMRQCAERVYENTGVMLEPEIRRWQPVFCVQ